MLFIGILCQAMMIDEPLLKMYINDDAGVK